MIDLLEKGFSIGQYYTGMEAHLYKSAAFNCLVLLIKSGNKVTDGMVQRVLMDFNVNITDVLSTPLDKERKYVVQFN